MTGKIKSIIKEKNLYIGYNKIFKDLEVKNWFDFSL